MTRRRAALAAAALASYTGAIVAANYLVAHIGLITVWPVPWLIAPAGVWCAGLAFPARDFVQRTLGWPAGVGAVLAGAALSWAISPVLAVASGVTFLVSETLDFAIYTPAADRWFTPAVIVSSCVAAVVDSLLFLHLAHIPYTVTIGGATASILGGQIFAKLAVIAVVGYPATRALRASLPVPALA